MELVELILDEENGLNGVYAVSYVNRPAIKADFFYFKDEEAVKFAAVNEEQRLVMGPLLIPNKPILRRTKEGEEFYAYLTADTIRDVAHNFLKNGHQNKSTLEHALEIGGISIVETWLVEDPDKDKSALYPVETGAGYWFGIAKIDNNEIWENYIKTGIVKGFSIEGKFKPVVQSTKLSAEQEIERGLADAYLALVNGLVGIRNGIARKH